MTINGCEGSSSSKSTTAAVWNVHACVWVPKLLRESKIDDVHQVCMLVGAHDDVAGLKVTVDEVARMDVLEATELTRHKLVQVLC